MATVDLSDPALKPAFEDVKSGKSPNNWVLFGFVAQTNKLKVFKTGKGGFAEMKGELSEARALFAFVRFVIRGMNKFLYLAWCGEAAPTLLKGRFAGQAKDMERFLTGFHVQVNARTEKDLDESSISAKLDKVMGANYDAGQKEQGTKKGGVASVAEGVQKVINPKQKEVKRMDPGNVGLESRNEFWQQQEKDPTTNADKGYKPVREDPSYQATQQREQFWKQQEEKPVGSDAGMVTPVPSSLGARNLKAQFEQKAVATEPAPAPPPPAAKGTGVAERMRALQQQQQPAKHVEPPPPTAAAAAVPPHQHPAEQQPTDEQQYVEQQQQQQEQPVPTDETAEHNQQQQQQEEQPAEQPVQGQEPLQEQQQNVVVATATYDYAGEQEGDLAFKVGDQITILDQSDPSGWWQGELNGAGGVFPSNFVQLNA